jgi:hypothetical protein
VPVPVPDFGRLAPGKPRAGPEKSSRKVPKRPRGPCLWNHGPIFSPGA